MYFPYLRGRQFELIALRELLEDDLIGNKIVPIIEPIKPTSTLAKTLSFYSEKEHCHALIMNPEVGNFALTIKEKGKQEDKAVTDIYRDLESQYLIKAYIMKKHTPKQLEKRKDLSQLMIVNPKRDCMEDYLKVYTGLEPEYTLLPDFLKLRETQIMVKMKMSFIQKITCITIQKAFGGFQIIQS